MPLDELQTLEQYLGRFGPALAARFGATHPPVFDPRAEAPHPRIAELLRRPYPAQAGAITALARALASRRGAVLCGEIGVGKTLVAAALLHVLHHDGFRALVVCPSHLLPKWRRELEATVSDIQIHELRGLADWPGARGPPRAGPGRPPRLAGEPRSRETQLRLAGRRPDPPGLDHAPLPALRGGAAIPPGRTLAAGLL